MNRIDYFASKFRGKVLNIGCFDSESYALMSKTCYPKLFGLDIVKGDKAKRIAKGDALNMTAKNEYDVIIAGELVEHFYPKQARQFLANCLAALKNGGNLIITTPNKSAWSNRLFHRFDSANPSEYQSHVHVFEINELRKLLEEQGFLVEECFCLPYSEEASPNHHGLVYAVRKLVHHFLPQSLQEEIVVCSKKAVPGEKSP